MWRATRGDLSIYLGSGDETSRRTHACLLSFMPAPFHCRWTHACRLSLIRHRHTAAERMHCELTLTWMHASLEDQRMLNPKTLTTTASKMTTAALKHD